MIPPLRVDGRIDRKIKISRPDTAASRDIFQMYLKKIPIAKGENLAKLAEVASAEFFSTQYCFASLHTRDAGIHPFTLGHMSSGAKLAGVVDQATSLALRRDIATGLHSGVSLSDLQSATRSLYHQNFDLNHSDEMAEFIDNFPHDQIVGITKTLRTI